MSYIDRNLLPDERIIFRTRKHLIIFFYPLVCAIVAMYAFTYMHPDPLLSKVEWVPVLLTAVFWLYVGVEYLSSEFAVTDRRVMMREGFFNRHANETRLAAISQVNIDQNILGQMLDFGMVSINAFGVFDAFPMLAHPYLFQRHVNEQLDKLVK